MTSRSQRFTTILCKNTSVLRFPYSLSLKSFRFRNYFPFLWKLVIFLIQYPYSIVSSEALSASTEIKEMPLGARSGQIIENEELRPLGTLEIRSFPKPSLQWERKVNRKKLEEIQCPVLFSQNTDLLHLVG